MSVEISAADSILCSLGESVARSCLNIPTTQGCQLLPVLTPRSNLYNAEPHGQHNLQMLVSPPLEASQAIVPPISYARAQLNTATAEEAETYSLPNEQHGHFRSRTHPFTSASEYNVSHALQPLSPPIQPYDQLGDTRVLLPPTQAYLTTQSGGERGQLPHAPSSRRWSDQADFAPPRSGQPRGWKAPSPTIDIPSGTSAQSTAKGKARKKQGPSVKRTEVGMACEFCRRRLVNNYQTGTFGVSLDLILFFLPCSSLRSCRINRKIRCSGEKPCRNCLRLSKVCEYKPVSASSYQPPRKKHPPIKGKGSEVAGRINSAGCVNDPGYA